METIINYTKEKPILDALSPIQVGASAKLLEILKKFVLSSKIDFAQISFKIKKPQSLFTAHCSLK